MGSLDYRTAGVDIDAGEEAVRRIKPLVASTVRPEVIGGIGGFGALFALDKGRYDDPVLVSSTDGVGTKAMIATATGRFDTIGIDLVAMCVDDIACQGAEPLWFLDYISVGRLDPTQVEQLVAGVADGCRQAGCALIGGEMAEHPGAMEPGAFDLVGFAVGVVERTHLVTPARMRDGDVLVGLLSPGLRSNGYSLARRVLLDHAGRALEAPAWDGASSSLADELLLPSVIYAPAIGALAAELSLHGVAHITGGGLPGNVPRMLPDDLDAAIHRSRWEVPPIFNEIARVGRVVESEMDRVFNMGIGMVVAISSEDEVAALHVLAARDLDAVVIGEVVAGSGQLILAP
ncbi:MAG TPA: phosphoribosylformylglycinamidine cyclo-ligase [Acidimicrobiales bacterium]|nr:phosphoribosylformylglycinamidine cyclo-ligase [Acidimicrobiales bacterium]